MFSQESYQYNSVSFARLLIAQANERKISVNMTKLQKLLYAAYGINAVVTESRLLNEYPHAWPYGPVFPTTRNKLLKVNDFYSISLENEELKDSASQLTEWSHCEGSPWEQTVSRNGFKWGDIIEDNLIRSYFSTIVTKK